MPTKIEWCHPPGYKGETWNPITGCAPVSEGCQNCYARRMAQRLKGRAGYPAAPLDPFRVTEHPPLLSEPKSWRKPRFVFVCSMGDLFHCGVRQALIARIMDRIAVSPKHLFVVLTKRAQRMATLLCEPGVAKMYRNLWPLPNLWLGVSCENQRWADERIPVLLQIPAAVRLVSLEPLLEPVGLTAVHRRLGPVSWVIGSVLGDTDLKTFDPRRPTCRGLDWVIVGGETGPGARLCKVEWIRQIVQDCKAAGVPCFVKALGSNSDHPGAIGRGADMSQWPEDLRVRQFPTTVHHRGTEDAEKGRT